MMGEVLEIIIFLFRSFGSISYLFPPPFTFKCLGSFYCNYSGFDLESFFLIYTTLYLTLIIV